MGLTPEQQELIMNSLWVVNTALKKQNESSNEDLRQSAILYLCKCVERYDASLKIKWTTFAYKNVYLFIKRTKLKEQQKTLPILSDDLFDIQTAMEKPTEECFENKLKVQQILEICTPQEQELIKLKLKGHTHKEIAEIMGIDYIKVKSIFSLIKSKCRGK